MPTKEEVVQALKKVIDPELGIDIVSLGMVKEVDTKNGSVEVTLELTTPACPFRAQLKDHAEKVLKALPGVSSVKVSVVARVLPSRAGEKILPGVKNIIAIASGKGGVGKSTVAVNVGLALAELGSSVGILDADIYGPTVPRILNVKVGLANAGDKIAPAISYNGVKVMSIGFLLQEDEPVIWRGPLVANAIRQFLTDVEWGDLDYLIVDLPPGTGDASLTLAQSIPLTGVVIVSTPQDAALRIATKALNMFRKLNVEIIGIVENMSYFVCPNCGHVFEIFGRGGVKAACERLGTRFLGEIPLSPDIRANGDLGKPVVIAAPRSESAEAFRKVAYEIAGSVSVIAYKRGKDSRG
ncbi:MAG: chromosome partitioning protein [Candidatus Terraquivivens tikiterensis]|uniref:Iron-sulfur cluster carrier protein n=1 Tax=Candidatus Terraquivivens tikiterensis TaxID=1980982 RepID=A0A2R7Y381_9ARCH|nr:MAG: chromosome partitioning protein [Candidatus Terraquivivens tikiterensis]